MMLQKEGKMVVKGKNKKDGNASGSAKKAKIETVNVGPGNEKKEAPAATEATALVAGAENKNKQAATQSGGNKKKLPGLIFMCSSKTKEMCFTNGVFGMPAGQKELVERIKPNARLFLYDFENKLMYGVYKAISSGGMNLVPNAFKASGFGSYPAQVRFKIERECIPMHEEVFKKAIKDNYYSKNKFNFELTHQQVNELVRLFRPLPSGPVNVVPSAAPAVEARQAAPDALFTREQHMMDGARLREEILLAQQREDMLRDEAIREEMRIKEEMRLREQMERRVIEMDLEFQRECLRREELMRHQGGGGRREYVDPAAAVGYSHQVLGAERSRDLLGYGAGMNTSGAERSRDLLGYGVGMNTSSAERSRDLLGYGAGMNTSGAARDSRNTTDLFAKTADPYAGYYRSNLDAGRVDSGLGSLYSARLQSESYLADPLSQRDARGLRGTGEGAGAYAHGSSYLTRQI